MTIGLDLKAAADEAVAGSKLLSDDPQVAEAIRRHRQLLNPSPCPSDEPIYVPTHWDRRYIGLAEYVSHWSKDPSTKVGAVITKDNHVVSVGFNGFPRRVADTPERLNNRELKYKMIVHGEINAMAFAHQDLTDCTLYTWPFAPCSVCAGQVIQRGIKRVLTPMNDNPRWIESFKLTSEMFREAGVSLIFM